jgi:hypothetical protein
MAADPLAAELAAIRELMEAPRERIGDLKQKAAAAGRLLAAVEAALKLAGDWTEHRPGDSPSLAACGSHLRAAIELELTRKDDSE